MVKMQRLGTAAQSRLVEELAQADFAALLRSQGPLTDDALAELIELDGRSRISAGRPVELKRYLDAVPDLPHRIVALDAAIDMALRSLMTDSVPKSEAVKTLERRYPALAEAIREAAALGDALCSTSELAARLRPQRTLALPLELGTSLADGRPRYLLTRCLGCGSQGQVYLATDRLLSEPDLPAQVAIKVLSSAFEGPHSRGRLAEEATKARRINHPNVVRVLDRGTTDTHDEYIVYEYVPGGDLSAFLATRGLPLEADVAIQLVSQIARGVHSAHAAGLVHCDLKPSNIMMDGMIPKVADFGVAVRLDSEPKARQTDSNSLGLGNIAFISPEQFQLRELGATIPSDIYSLGGLLYFLITSRLPNGSSFTEICLNLENSADAHPPSVRAVLPHVDRDLESVCQRAMDRKPLLRHQSAGEFADDLDRLLRRESIPWTRPSVTRRTRLAIRRRPLTFAICTALAVGITLAIGISVRSIQHAREEQAETAYRQKLIDHGRGRIEELYAMMDRFRSASPPKPKVSSLVLTQGLLMQWALGSDLFKFTHRAPQIWKDRIELGYAALSEGSGIQPGSLEEKLWGSSLAYWLVCSDMPDEALDILTKNQQAWASMLAPADPWLLQLQALEACAIVRRELKHHEAGLSVDLESCRRAEANLCGEKALFSPGPEFELGARYRGVNEGTGLHILVLQTLIDLYSSPLRNDPTLRGQAEHRLELYLSRQGKKAAT